MKDQLTPNYPLTELTEFLICMAVLTAMLIAGFWANWGAVCAFVGG